MDEPTYMSCWIICRQLVEVKLFLLKAWCALKKAMNYFKKLGAELTH